MGKLSNLHYEHVMVQLRFLSRLREHSSCDTIEKAAFYQAEDLTSIGY